MQNLPQSQPQNPSTDWDEILEPDSIMQSIEESNKISNQFNEADNHIYMTGPAEPTFRGEYKVQ